ncbi:hypothetical protein QBC36DRAFT_188623 [Triangularia setosa]|uniref:Uncharacterized protein n=1 Tax=Triangularia setosa TaxID=2587417 RepID=A0AAN7A5D0_9PEZI|nr:hypothetical protein QBC36DRAFT_188623 [Podospora setosa]
MKTFAVFVAIAALASFAVAAPTPEPSPEAIASPSAPVEERQSIGVFVTKDINWGGESAWIPVTRGACITFNSAWVNTVTSFGPDSGLSCHLFDCGGTSIGPIFNPGYASLGSIGWNDRINSFRCV